MWRVVWAECSGKWGMWRVVCSQCSAKCGMWRVVWTQYSAKWRMWRVVCSQCFANWWMWRVVGAHYSAKWWMWRVVGAQYSAKWGCYVHYSSHKYHHTVRRITFVNMVYNVCWKKEANLLIFEDKLKRRSYGYCTHCWKPNVYIIKTHFWSWIILSSPKYRNARVTNTRNLTLTYFL
jgi:hypothetical protein